MSTSEAKRNAIGRAFIAGLALWLLVAQGLTFRHVGKLGGSHSFENVLISAPDASGELCLSRGGGGGPAHERGDCANHDCCVSNARDRLLGALLRNVSLEVLFLPGPPFLLVKIAHHRNREPLGWASSWSSRAPPPIS